MFLMPRSVNRPYEKGTKSERIQRNGKELWDCIRARGATSRLSVSGPHDLALVLLGRGSLILGVSGSYLRQLSIDGLRPTPELGTAGRRSYTLRQINKLRAYLALARPKEAGFARAGAKARNYRSSQ
jgi:chromosome partitioning protein